MFAGHDQALLELLTDDPRLPAVALADIWARHKAGEGSFGDLVVATGHLAATDLLAKLATQLGCEWIERLPSVIAPEVLKRVPLVVARHYHIIPVDVEAESLTVVPFDSWSATWSEELAFALGVQIKLALADPTAAKILWERYYTGGASVGLTEQGNLAKTDELIGLSVTEIAAMAGQGVVSDLVNTVLRQAIRDRASDIHFEPFADEFKIRFRLDGALYDLPSPGRDLALPVISRLKVLANLDIAERRLPQDGRIRWADGDRAVDLRVSTLPTQDGESVVLRVLDQTSVWLDIEQLGLPPLLRVNLESAIQRPNGIILVTGPTGSGKTTTLYSCLKKLNEPESKLLTIEDPVEYEIDGIMQVAVNPGAGLTFARALRSFLRQDPDIVMVGEIRDVETARIAIQAALTGHLVFTTLHTNDAVSAVTRLVDMGIEPYLLAATLEVVLAQRLVRHLCAACKRPAPVDEAIAAMLEIDPVNTEQREIFQPVGCPRCHQTGYLGRCGLFECLVVSESLREMIADGKSVQELRVRSRSQGTGSLRAAGGLAVLAGETSVDEVMKNT